MWSHSLCGRWRPADIRDTSSMGHCDGPRTDLHVVSCQIKKDNIYLNLYQTPKLMWLYFQCPDYVKYSTETSVEILTCTRLSVYFFAYVIASWYLSGWSVTRRRYNYNWNCGETNESLVYNDLWLSSSEVLSFRPTGGLDGNHSTSGTEWWIIWPRLRPGVSLVQTRDVSVRLTSKP